MKPTVVLTHAFHKETVHERLAPHARVLFARTPAALTRALPRADALLCQLTDRIDERLLARAPRLKAVANYAVGTNNIDSAACRARGVTVLNTPDVLTRSTAELATALLLAVARRVPEGERLVRSGRWKGWAPDQLLGLELQGRQAVLVGAGRIGRETGRIFEALGLRVEFVDRRSSPGEVRTALARAQVLSLHIPGTPANRHWLSRERIALLPKDAVVINTARGTVIDEKALITALRTRRIFGAGLDVFEREPAIPAALRKLPNTVLLPHLGSATTLARRRMAELAIDGLIAVLNGQSPPNRVQV